MAGLMVDRPTRRKTTFVCPSVFFWPTEDDLRPAGHLFSADGRRPSAVRPSTEGLLREVLRSLDLFDPEGDFRGGFREGTAEQAVGLRAADASPRFLLICFVGDSRFFPSKKH